MNVVFDFGGVLLRWVPHEVVSQVLPARTPSAEAAHALVADFFQNFTGDWQAFDRGTIEPDPLARRIAERTGLALDEAQAVIDAIPHALVPVPGTVALLERLHAAGRPLYYLSNMPAPFADHLEANRPFMGLFRQGVFSARVKLVKPERAIFDHAVAAFGIDPANSLFIDDFEHNVEAARAAGWQALHFSTPEQCAADLEALGLV
jgi:putative hydrolase of the HAD superfamily